MASPPNPTTPSLISTAERHEGEAAASRIVGRNMFALVVSQFVTTPVSLFVNAILARSLGASNFGAIYLATTVLTLLFIFVEWGGQGQIAAIIARDRPSAARVFGTGLVMRIGLGAAVLWLLPHFVTLMGYGPSVRTALLLCGFRFALASVGTLCSAVMRGFEKVDWHAGATIFGNLIDATLVVGTLLQGGGLRAALTAQVVAAAITLVLQFALVLRLKIGRAHVDVGALRVLVGGGFSFLVLDVVLKLQPYIDAGFLSKLSSAQALGWYSAANRITGVLVFPAFTLSLALYPTLARLWSDDRTTYNIMVRLGLRSVILLGLLAGTGAAVFSRLIVRLVYGVDAFGPAATDIAILSLYLPLVYASLVIGNALMAAGRQLRWAVGQSFCLLVSVALDPILIPWTQRTYGNGGAGVCISVAFAEIAMVGVGLGLLPTGALDKSLAKTLGRCVVAAAGAAAIGVFLEGIPVLAIPATVTVYASLLWVQREIDPNMLMLLRNLVLSKFARTQVSGDEPTTGTPSPEA